jgi:hypothetical protein
MQHDSDDKGFTEEGLLIIKLQAENRTLKCLLRLVEDELLTIDGHINYGKMSRYSSKRLCSKIKMIQDILGDECENK